MDCGPCSAPVAVEIEGPCGDFDARPELSPEEHMRRYGCPPCPCVCKNGEIICAPCVACEGFGDGSRVEPIPEPTPTSN